MAVVMISSPRNPAHSEKPLFEVMINDVFSCMAEIGMIYFTTHSITPVGEIYDILSFNG